MSEIERKSAVEDEGNKLREESTGGIKETSKIPQPVAVGSDGITIQEHGIYRKVGEGEEVELVGVDFTIKNVSDLEICTAVYEVVFYDVEGKALDTVKQKTVELRPKNNRKIRVISSGDFKDKVKSYSVKVLEVVFPPAPVVIEHEKIKILKHCISSPEKVEVKNFPNSIEFAVKNISGENIATAVFEVMFYDVEGNLLEEAEKRVNDLKANMCRAINVDCHVMKFNILKSYSIKVTRVVTMDVEKVQVRRHEKETTEDGEEKITGTIKNISEEKTDAALVAQYYDISEELVGLSVLPLRDVEPNETRNFEVRYRPQEEDKVAKYKLTIADIVEY